MSAPILHLPARRAAMLADWLHRLDACAPGSPEAKAIYVEAAGAGLSAELRAALKAGAAAALSEVSAMKAELARRTLRGDFR